MDDEKDLLKKEGKRAIKLVLEIIGGTLAIVILYLLLSKTTISAKVVLIIAICLLFMIIAGFIGYKIRLRMVQNKTTESSIKRKLGYIFLVLGILLILIKAIQLLFIEKNQIISKVNIIQIGVGFGLVLAGVKQLKAKPKENSLK